MWSYRAMPACCFADSLPCPLGVPQRFLPGGRLATKSSDGRMYVWRLDSSSSTDGSSGGSSGSGAMEVAATWKVPHCSGGSGWQNRCQFGGTADGRYIAAVRRCCCSCVALLLLLPPSLRSCQQLAVCSAAELCRAAHPQLSVPVCIPASFSALAGQQQGRLLCV